MSIKDRFFVFCFAPGIVDLQNRLKWPRFLGTRNLESSDRVAPSTVGQSIHLRHSPTLCFIEPLIGPHVDHNLYRSDVVISTCATLCAVPPHALVASVLAVLGSALSSSNETTIRSSKNPERFFPSEDDESYLVIRTVCTAANGRNWDISDGPEWTSDVAAIANRSRRGSASRTRRCARLFGPRRRTHVSPRQTPVRPLISSIAVFRFPRRSLGY
uniref:Uncharacterized protein n=1 Tax=Steinernema glaseri TaxID=37863 RepID=A0A1I7Y6W8_9BILA